LGGRHLVPWLDRGDPGVGDDDVEPAQFLDCGVEDRLELCVVTYVGGGYVYPAALGLDLLGSDREIVEGGQWVGHRLDLIADVDRDHVCVFGGESDGVTSALPLAAPVMNTTLPSNRAIRIPCVSVGPPGGFSRPG
jgi:hypothetical protein